MRLVAPDAAEPEAPATRALVARALGQGNWEGVVAAFDAARQEVRAAWDGVTHGQAARSDADGI
jgi:glutamate-ammonia-ligase adenylyltransferase